MSITTEVIVILEFQWVSKVLIFECLGQFPPETMLIFIFPRLHTPQHPRNIELRGRGIRDLTLDGNKLEQMLKYRKAWKIRKIN